MTKIIKCICRNKYQDEKYGDQHRVHNSKIDYEKTGYTCTVCGKINFKKDKI